MVSPFKTNNDIVPTISCENKAMAGVIGIFDTSAYDEIPRYHPLEKCILHYQIKCLRMKFVGIVMKRRQFIGPFYQTRKGHMQPPFRWFHRIW